MLRPSSRTEARKKGFKKAIDADEARRKREEGMIQIRKDKREEAMLKKRRCVWGGREYCRGGGVPLDRHPGETRPTSCTARRARVFRTDASRGGFPRRAVAEIWRGPHTLTPTSRS